MAKIRYVRGRSNSSMMLWWLDEWTNLVGEKGAWSAMCGVTRRSCMATTAVKIEFHICCHRFNAKRKQFSHVSYILSHWYMTRYRLVWLFVDNALSRGLHVTTPTKKDELSTNGLVLLLELLIPWRSKTGDDIGRRTRRDILASTVLLHACRLLASQPAWRRWWVAICWTEMIWSWHKPFTASQAFTCLVTRSLLSSDLCACIIWSSLTFDNNTSTKTFL